MKKQAMTMRRRQEMINRAKQEQIHAMENLTRTVAYLQAVNRTLKPSARPFMAAEILRWAVKMKEHSLEIEQAVTHLNNLWILRHNKQFVERVFWEMMQIVKKSVELTDWVVRDTLDFVRRSKPACQPHLFRALEEPRLVPLDAPPLVSIMPGKGARRRRS